jgi:hypothetical protein
VEDIVRMSFGESVVNSAGIARVVTNLECARTQEKGNEEVIVVGIDVGCRLANW